MLSKCSRGQKLNSAGCAINRIIVLQMVIIVLLFGYVEPSLAVNSIIPLDSWIYGAFESLAVKDLLTGAERQFRRGFEMDRTEGAVYTVLALSNMKDGDFSNAVSIGLELEDLKKLQRLVVEFSKEIPVRFPGMLDGITIRVIALDRAVKGEEARIESIRKGTAMAKDELSPAADTDRLPFVVHDAFAEAARLYGQGDIRGALVQINRVLDREHDNPQALMIQGNLLAESGDTIRAREAYRLILARDPSYVEARMARASLLAAERDWEGAREELRKALESDPNLLDARFQLALILANSGDYLKSIIEYKAVIEKDPFNIQAHTGLGVVYGLKSDAARSGMMFRKAIALDPGKAYVRLEYARTLARLGDYSEAREQIEKAIALDPADRESLRLKARILELAGNGAAALNAYLALLRVYPSDTEALSAIAANYLATGDAPRARETYEMILSLVPGDRDAMTGYGKTLIHLGEYGVARAQFERVLQVEQRADALVGIGDAMLWMGSEKRAMENYSRALQLEPDNLMAAFGLATAAMLGGHWHTARLNFELAKRISPDAAFIYSDMGNMYAYLGMFNKAKANLSQALKLLAERVGPPVTSGVGRMSELVRAGGGSSDWEFSEPRAREFGVAATGGILSEVESADDPEDTIRFTHATQRKATSRTRFENVLEGYLNDSLSYRSMMDYRLFQLQGSEDSSRNVGMAFDYRLGMYTTLGLGLDFDSSEHATSRNRMAAEMSYDRGAFSLNVFYREEGLEEDIYESLADIDRKTMGVELRYLLNPSFTLALKPMWEAFDTPANHWGNGVYSQESNRRSAFDISLKYRPMSLRNTTLTWIVSDASFDSELDQSNLQYYYFTPASEKGVSMGINYDWRGSDQMKWGAGYIYHRDRYTFLSSTLSAATNGLSAYFTRKIGGHSELGFKYSFEKTRDADPVSVIDTTLNLRF